MTDVHLFSIVAGMATMLAMLELVRRRQLREKYAVLWLGLGVAVGLLGLFPGLLNWIADKLHVADPPNLLLAVGVLVLLLVQVHLSWELSRLEDKTRTMAEEIAMLRLSVEDLERDSHTVEPDGG
jgi:hypothetical protein